MLEGVQAYSGDCGGVGMPENAKNPAFLPQPIRVEIQIRRAGIRMPRIIHNRPLRLLQISSVTPKLSPPYFLDKPDPYTEF